MGVFSAIATGGATGLSQLLTDLGTIFTQMVTWVTTVASTIVDTPVLLLTFGIFVFYYRARAIAIIICYRFGNFFIVFFRWIYNYFNALHNLPSFHIDCQKQVLLQALHHNEALDLV